MASIGSASSGEPSLADLIEPIFGGRSPRRGGGAVSVAIAFTVVTSIHVVLGEQAPKMLAITGRRARLRILARPLAAFRARAVLHAEP